MTTDNARISFREAHPDIWRRATDAVMAPKVNGALFGENYILPLAIAMRELIEAQAARVKELEAGLSASVGYLLNAKIDLETGATKATAIRTIEGGITRARALLTPSEPKP